MTTYDASVWPPMALPTVQATTGDGGTAEPPVAPPLAVPEPTATESVDFTPVAVANATVETEYVRPHVTQAETDAEFGIVNGSNVVTNPYPLA